MSNFYVGQKVVYITGLNLPKDSIHVVNGVHKFPCGCIALDISIDYDLHIQNPSINLCEKHDTHIPYVGTGLWNSNSFRPLLTDSIKFAEETLTQVTEHIKSRELILNN